MLSLGLLTFSLVPRAFQAVVSVVILVPSSSHHLLVIYIVLHSEQSMKHVCIPSKHSNVLQDVFHPLPDLVSSTVMTCKHLLTDNTYFYSFPKTTVYQWESLAASSITLAARVIQPVQL